MKKITLSIFAAGLLHSFAFGAENLGEVVVTSSSKLPQKIKETTQNVTIITAEDIKERGYQSLLEVLSNRAGFVTASNGGLGQSSSVFVRGLSSDNLLVLLDGVPLTDYTQPGAAAALEHIAIDSVAKIEIIKGGQSGIWGASAAAGTVNIITKGAQSDSTTVAIKGGSHATKGVGVDFAKSFAKASVAFGAHWLDSDGISALAPRNAEKDGYKNINLYLKSSIKVNENSNLLLFARSDDGKFDFDSGFADDKSSKGKSKQKLLGFEYSYNLEALTLDAKVSYRKIDRELKGSGAFGPWSFDSTGKTTQLSLNGSYQISKSQNITIGLEHTINKAKTDSGFAKSDAKFKNSAVFASYTQIIKNILGADTTLNGVVRYDNFDKFDNKVTYRVGIKRECKLVDGLHSAANIYTGYKAPSLYQFSNATGELKPESIKGFDVTLGYKNYLNITYFSNKIKDKISANYNPATYSVSYANSGDGVKVSGIEVSGEYAFGDSGFVLGANFTHMLKFKDDSGKKAQRVPQNSASVSLDYYFNDSSHVGVVANYVGKRRDIDYSAYPAKDVILKSYTTVDLTFNTQFKENFNLNVTVKNIFDKKYETVKGYSTEGRSIYATVEYMF